MVREDLKTKDIYDTTDCHVSRERTVPEMGYLVTAHGAGVRTKASPHLRGADPVVWNNWCTAGGVYPSTHSLKHGWERREERKASAVEGVTMGSPEVDSVVSCRREGKDGNR